MKKKFLTSIFITVIFITGTFSANAIFCSNCKNVFQGLIERATQVLQYGKEAITAGQTSITAVNTTMMRVNDLIIKPLNDAMTLISIAQSGKNVQNLIMGSLGTEKLLVGDPQQLFKDAMSEVQLGALGDIASGGSAFGESILGTLFENAKFDSFDLKEKLSVINSSGIPEMMSGKICESDAGLTKIIQNSGSFTQEELTAKKKELFDFACSGSPTSKEQAAKLIALNDQNPTILNSADVSDGTIGNGFLSLTSGNNAYVKAEKSKVLIDQAAEEKKKQAEADLAAGRGIKSLTECVEYAEFTPNGEPYSDPEAAPCKRREVIQTSGVLDDQFKEALGTPLKTLIASFGTGAGQLIGSAFNAISLFQGISNSIGSLSGGGGGGSGGSPSGLSATFNNPLVIKVNQTPVPNLANNSTAKNNLIKTPLEHLTAHTNALNSLATSDNAYLSQISYYTSQTSAMSACFNQIATTYNAANDARVVAGVTYATSLNTSNNTLKAKIENELALIETTKTLIASTRASMEASQSSEEILTIFTTYQNKITDQGLPGLTSGLSREGEFETYKGEIQQSLYEGGILFNYKAECATLSSQYQQNQQNSGGGTVVGGGGGAQ